jgi:hypothetical protein
MFLLGIDRRVEPLTARTGRQSLIP